ncbi:MAG TPA: hypothetical protein VMA75_04295 [Candidatus Paceibacterota bacterium]|nr:hypothetical protein [Candidatus Paceibacterota bacterium]
MSTRRAKQLIYGTLYIVLIILFCAAVYTVFIRPFTGAPAIACAPSTCAPTSTAPIVPGAVATFVTSPGQYTFLAQVTDENANYAAQALDYSIDLENASGTVLQSIPARAFVYPSQTRYLAVLNQSVGQPFDHAVLSVTDVSWIASSTLGAIPGIGPGEFALQNIQSASASTTVSVGGQIVNTSVASYEQVFVMVIFTTPGGTPVGVSQTELENVAAGSTNDFSVIYPNEPEVNPALNQTLIYAIR